LKLSRTSEEDEEEECLQCIAGVAVKNGVTGIKMENRLQSTENNIA